MKINRDVWDEFILWGHVVLAENPEATIYDLFMRVRLENGNQPFSENFLKIVDYDIAAEERRNKKKIHPIPYPDCVKNNCKLHPWVM